MVRRSGAALAVASWLVAAFVAGPARAQAKNDAAAAESLFTEGKRLMAAGQVSAACPKFLESQRLDPGIGTMLWLGDCYAKNGQIASAWAVFHEAEALAAKQKDPRVKVAREEAQKLEPRISKLVLDVSEVAALPDLTILRDGVALGKPLWGTPIPIDGGTHVILASARSKKSWETRISVPVERGMVTVKIPPLEDEIAPPPPPLVAGPEPSRPPPDPAQGRTQRVIGIAVAGVGVVGLALGGYFGLNVKSKNEESKDHCDLQNRCNQTGFGLREDALRYATYSDIAFIVGGAALVGGAILFLTAPRPARLAVSAGALAGGGGAFVHGRF